MTIRQTIAEHGTEICLGTLGIAGLGASAVAVPMAVLATLGAERLQECDRAILLRAKQAIEHLQALNALDGGEAQRTRDLLQGAHLKLRFSADDLLTLRESPTLPDDLIARILPATDLAHETASVRNALGEVLQAAFQELFTAGKTRDAVNFAALLRLLARQKEQIDGWDSFAGTARQRHTELRDAIEATRDDIAVVHTELSATRDDLATGVAGLHSRLDRITAQHGIDAETALTEIRDLAADYNMERVHRASFAQALDHVRKTLAGLETAIARFRDNTDAPARFDNLRHHVADLLRNDRIPEAGALFEEAEAEMAASNHAVKVADLAYVLEGRAQVAILEHRVEDALTLYSRAADSFAAIDPLEPARRRIMEYAPILYDYSLRFNGPGFECTESLLRPILSGRLKVMDAHLWAAGSNSLATVLFFLGARQGGEEGADLLTDAVSSWEDSLNIRTLRDDPYNWAMTMNNIGIALLEQAKRSNTRKALVLLSKAEDGFYQALTVRTCDKDVGEWAMTQNNLGMVLQARASISEEPKRSSLFATAAKAYCNSLKGRKRRTHPRDWAASVNNLGTVWDEWGVSTPDPDGTNLLRSAERVYRAALSVRTYEDLPLDWAQTKNNLGNTLLHRGLRCQGQQRDKILAEAIFELGESLTIYSFADFKVEWARTNRNLAQTEFALAEQVDAANTAQHLSQALEHVDDALKVYDPVHMPSDHEYAASLRERICTKLSQT